MKEAILCKNCKHMYRTPIIKQCVRNETLIDLVNGVYAACADARAGACGRVGHYYERKNG